MQHHINLNSNSHEKKTCLLALVLPVVMLCSCKQDESVVFPDSIDDAVPAEQYGRSCSKALDNAFDLMRDIYPEKHKTLVSRKHLLKPEYYTTATLAATRGVQIPTISAKGENGESASLDTLLYIVNFGNDEGFAVMLADENSGNDILAIAESGSLTIDDLMRASGDETDSTYDDTPARTMAALFSNGPWVIVDGGKFPCTGDIDVIDMATYQYGPWTNDGTLVAPLVKKKYHQGTPYNEYCPVKNGIKAPVGCVAVALMHIMSVHNYPTSINGYSGNWYDASYDLLAHYAREIGRICCMNYGAEGSSSTDFMAKCCLNKYDRYRNLDIKKDVSINTVSDMIQKGWPVYCSGYDKEKDKGHAWVLDGLYRQKRWRKKVTVGGYYIDDGYSYRTLVHCEFGWGGDCNGYYVADCFNLYNGPVVDIDESDLKKRDRYYNYNTQIITYKFN